MIKTTSEPMKIINYKNQIVNLLLDFRPNCSAYQNTRDAIEEIEESLKQDKKRISILAFENGEAIGWIAGSEFYGKVIEIHTIVVKYTKQHSGTGRILLTSFEKRAKELGFLSVFAGSGDCDCSTSIGGIELYPFALEKLMTIKNIKNHPFEFYLKCGFELVGVLPDAHGKGKPDIYFGKTI